MMTDYRSVSLWLDQYPGSLEPRAALDGNTTADVAIVGAGFTGLWTAYYLLGADPSLRVVIVEKEIAGFGASGRNGGWVSALFPASWERIARDHGREAALAMRDAMRDSVTEVGAVAEREGIDCGFHRGGTVVFARNEAQLARARAEVLAEGELGDDDLRFLDSARSAEIAGATGVLGATHTPHCAVVDPARLVRGLAERVEARGAVIYERSPVTAIEPGRIMTKRGAVSAKHVIRATEAFTVTLPGHRRDYAPVYSLIVATEPLSEEVLRSVGLKDRPTFADFGHVVCYGQRTEDGRIVFGGRGAPYHFGSAMEPDFDRDPAVFGHLRRQIVEMFPALAGVRFTHSWGGAVAAPRDWHASVNYDAATGLGYAGGYVGDGVSTTNLAGRTLADLVLGRTSELTSLPWVGHQSRKWEPEPLRYLGVNAGFIVMSAADRAEDRRGKPSKMAGWMGKLLGG